MASPIPVWWDVEANAGTLTWSVGTVDADSYSNEKEFIVWNNKGGSTDVSDMTNVFITTKDITGNDTGLIAGPTPKADVEVAIHNGIADTWSTWKAIRGSNPVTQQDILNEYGLVDASSGKANILKGNANDGNTITSISKKNYCKLRLRLHVYPDAPAGSLSWKTRISYQYV